MDPGNNKPDLCGITSAKIVDRARPPRRTPRPPAPPAELCSRQNSIPLYLTRIVFRLTSYTYFMPQENMPPVLRGEMLLDRMGVTQTRINYEQLKKDSQDLEMEIKQLQDNLDSLARLQARSLEGNLFNKINEIQIIQTFRLMTNKQTDKLSDRQTTSSYWHSVGQPPSCNDDCAQCGLSNEVVLVVLTLLAPLDVTVGN
ncbi:hypothetical protein EVAR_11422_1 [Eumeta japonica]|uniref:Uncharacterized protein n=1 Tax=Eumeta variegata TaxID=151549 RepID=A0A4C1TN14_EUMVA|nr:hypothetical protein EVAR_11422_1 [Eumeta japonica]